MIHASLSYEISAAKSKALMISGWTRGIIVMQNLMLYSYTCKKMGGKRKLMR